jgi:BASS family bile acid:Na+ symporter
MTGVLPFALVLIMGSLGLSLTRADFARVARSPRAIALGMANFALLGPLLAAAVAAAFDLEPLFAVGLVLLGAAPGGAMANLLTHLARGDTALAVSMTALTSLFAALTVPLYYGFAVDSFDAPVEGSLGTTGVALTVLAITVLPLLTGMAARERRPEWVERNHGRVMRLALVVFVALVAGIFATEGDVVVEHAGELLAATIVLNLTAMTLAFALARTLRLSLPQATAVSIELGLHNAALAITVSTLIDPVIALPAAVYSVVMFVTAGSFAALMARRNVVQTTSP